MPRENPGQEQNGHMLALLLGNNFYSVIVSLVAIPETVLNSVP